MSLSGPLVQGDHEADRGRETTAGAGGGHLQAEPAESEAGGLRPVLLQGLQPPGQGGQPGHRPHWSSLHPSLVWRPEEQSGVQLQPALVSPVPISSQPARDPLLAGQRSHSSPSCRNFDAIIFFREIFSDQ